MYTIREGIEKIRSLASAWLTDQTTDGSTAMGEVAATLLNTSFEDVHYLHISQPLDEERLAEVQALSKPASVAQSTNIYEGITDSDVLVRLESRINAAEHPPGTWADNRQRMGSICTKTNHALSLLAIENGWASFNFKRDGWLAVEAVNALPELIARVRSSEAGERAADAEVERLQGLLDAAKSLGTAACDQVIATCNEQTPALRDVAAERLRQVSVEGYKPERDDCYTSGEMAQAAGAYAIYSTFERDGLSLSMAAANLFPWDMVHWKGVDHRRNLVKAGALILAEIERLDRRSTSKPAELYTAAEEARMDVVGQNGNDGEHYETPISIDQLIHAACPPDLAKALSPQSPWIEHGPSSPHPFDNAYLAKVDILLRDGTEVMNTLACNVSWFWYEHDKHQTDVVGFRPHKSALEAAGWTEWSGELCPVDDLDAMVWVRLEGVDEDRPGIARNWDWRTEPAMGRSRIVAYRLTDPAVKP